MRPRLLDWRKKWLATLRCQSGDRETTTLREAVSLAHGNLVEPGPKHSVER